MSNYPAQRGGNTPVAGERKMAFSVAISTTGYQKLIAQSISDKTRRARFIASITSAVATNPQLQACEPATILSGALLGEGLNLSPSPQLGQFYLVPFNNRKENTTKATFVLGYKGYIQLAIRSGQYKKLTVMELKEGELVRFDPLTEDIEVSLIDDFEEREATPTTGYYAMFEYTNGFRKAIYWSKEKMISHADKFSPAFSKNATDGKYPKVSYADYCAGNYNPKDEWLYSSFWYKNFDDMAKKTMIRQLISKWGIMSVDLQDAMQMDNTVAVPTETFDDIVTTDELPANNAPDFPEETQEIATEQPQLNTATQQVNLADL